MEGWRAFLQEADRDAELARLKSYAGKSPLEILQMQDDGSPEFAKIKDILVAAEKQKKAALKDLQTQEKAYAAEKEEYARAAEERVKERTAMMDKFEAQMQQIAQQSNNPAAAAVAAAQDAKTEKLKQKSAQIEQEFNKRMDAIAAGTRAPEQKGAPVEHFDGDSGQPLTKKGEQICAKNPRCFDEFIKPDIASGGQTGFSSETGQPLKDLIAIAKQNKS
tara:strand:+ start:105 stop:764 length:660 start_codon:yes stop_codon:yes gene_type:complete